MLSLKLDVHTSALNNRKNKLHEQVSRNYRSNRPEVFLGKGVLKICSKYTGELMKTQLTEDSCQSAISTKLLCSFIEIALRHGYSPVNLFAYFQYTFL